MQKVVRPRNVRGEGDKLRGELVAAARVLLEEGGSEDAVTLRAVARKAGVTAPAIYLHFADRDELLLQVLGSAFQDLEHELRAATRSDQNSLDRLHALVEAYTAFALSQPNTYRALFGRRGAARTAVMTKERPVDELMGSEAIGILTEALQACRAQGFTDSADPQADAAAVWAGVHGYTALRAGVPAFPWPDGILHTMVDRLAGITSGAEKSATAHDS